MKQRIQHFTYGGEVKPASTGSSGTLAPTHAPGVGTVNIGGATYHLGFVEGDSVSGFNTHAPVRGGATDVLSPAAGGFFNTGNGGLTNPVTFTPASGGFGSFGGASTWDGSNNLGDPATAAQNPFVSLRPDMQSFAVGGEVGQGGLNMDLMQGQGPLPPAQTQQGTPLGGAAIESGISGSLQSNPQAAAMIREEVMQAMQSGELTQQELQTVGNLVRAALRNPEVYPQLRQYAISNGLGEADDIPEQYDEGFLSLLLSVVQAVDSTGANDASMTPMGKTTDMGGVMPEKSKNPGGEVPIVAHEGEFVLHKGAVRAMGLDKLRALNEKYDHDGNQKPREKATA